MSVSYSGNVIVKVAWAALKKQRIKKFICNNKNVKLCLCIYQDIYRWKTVFLKDLKIMYKATTLNVINFYNLLVLHTSTLFFACKVLLRSLVVKKIHPI